jgi:hypothetical protein
MVYADQIVSVNNDRRNGFLLVEQARFEPNVLLYPKSTIKKLMAARGQHSPSFSLHSEASRISSGQLKPVECIPTQS